MHGADCVWVAGDAIAYPMKFGGLASQQADAVAVQAGGVPATLPPAPLETPRSTHDRRHPTRHWGRRGPGPV